jgi:hypothetical protein
VTRVAKKAADRYRDNLRGEVDSAALYRMLATAESGTELAEVYRRLASVEDRHAELWQTKLREAGHEPLTIAPGARVRFLGWLALRFGADTVLPFVLAGEAADIQPEARAAGLPADERSHGRVLRPPPELRSRSANWSEPDSVSERRSLVTQGNVIGNSRAQD